MAGCLPDIEALAPDDLKGLVLQLLEDVVALKAENAALREEIARLKGLKGPPKLKPSGMEKATEPARAERKAGRRGGKIDRLVIDEERVLKAAVPPGSRFKGYEAYVVQELILRPHVIRYRRERWITPDGRTVVAALPAGTVGHFGPELRRFVLGSVSPGPSDGTADRRAFARPRDGDLQAPSRASSHRRQGGLPGRGGRCA